VSMTTPESVDGYTVTNRISCGKNLMKGVRCEVLTSDVGQSRKSEPHVKLPCPKAAFRYATSLQRSRNLANRALRILMWHQIPEQHSLTLESPRSGYQILSLSTKAADTLHVDCNWRHLHFDMHRFPSKHQYALQSTLFTACS